jgi:hypothetical protein
MQYEVAKTVRLLTPNGPLNLFPGQVVLLQPERALNLIAAGKLKPLPEPADIEEYCKLCSQAIERINNQFYPQAHGWISWTKGKNPELWEEVEAAEKDLESPIDRGISLEQFSNLVSHWEKLLMQAIENYLKRPKGEIKHG